MREPFRHKSGLELKKWGRLGTPVLTASSLYICSERFKELIIYSVQKYIWWCHVLLAVLLSVCFEKKKKLSRLYQDSCPHTETRCKIWFVQSVMGERLAIGSPQIISVTSPLPYACLFIFCAQLPEFRSSFWAKY